ncbi:site-2 protease family protein [Salegentibacter sp.]|uniref:site-2 protease family protein n=1 Tax=Salegentibacter sp. TaxID=1903072 RepID=UPI0035659FCA
MVSISDIPKFLLAFFLVLPVISILHEAGHVFFAWLMGGKNIKVSVGSGQPVFKWGMIEIRQYYFWYGLCTYENIKRKNKFANILIFSGGALFNLLGAIGVMILIENEVLEAGILTYQFTYFSLYYIFFALLPMLYPGGNYSDGKMILDLLRNKENVIKEHRYRIKWKEEKKEWEVTDHNDRLIGNFEKEEEAMKKARRVAGKNRPSSIIKITEEGDREIQNYPKIPL